MNEKDLAQAIKNPQNRGEMSAADAMGTAGSPGCGDMLRIWLKFKEGREGKKVIDRATFQSFGCETAIAVASVATELLKGKTIEEAKHLSGSELAAPLGALPPMKIHCATLVEEALRDALEILPTPKESTTGTGSGHLRESLVDKTKSKGRIVLLKPDVE